MFVCFRYCFDGKLFNLRRLQAKSKGWTEVLDEFLFADNMAKVAPTEEKMQKGVDQVSDSCDSYDLTISIKKAEVIYQPAPGKPYKEPTITVKGQLMTWQRLLHQKRRCKKMWIKYLIHDSYKGPAKSFVTGFGLLHCCILSNIFLLQTFKVHVFPLY